MFQAEGEVCTKLRRLGKAHLCSFARQPETVPTFLVTVDPVSTQAKHGAKIHFTAKMGRARVWTLCPSDFQIHALSMITCMWNFPDQGSNSCPLHWKRGVLTTRPPGKCSMTTILSKVCQHLVMWGDSSSLSTIQIFAKVVNILQYKGRV